MEDLTALWNAAGRVRAKRPNTWANRKSTQRLLAQHSPEAYQVSLGRTGRILASAPIAEAYRAFLGADYQSQEEQTQEAALAQRLKARRQVKTPAGPIDLLSPTIVGEVKLLRSWKSALGQVLAYGFYYPKHEKVLYLFGASKSANLKQTVEQVCSSLGVRVEFI